MRAALFFFFLNHVQKSSRLNQMLDDHVIRGVSLVCVCVCECVLTAEVAVSFSIQNYMNCFFAVVPHLCENTLHLNGQFDVGDAFLTAQSAVLVTATFESG